LTLTNRVHKLRIIYFLNLTEVTGRFPKTLFS
jgi:hypothetical protein